MSTPRAEAELWATCTALTSTPLPDDAARLLQTHPEVVAATEPRLDLAATVVDTDREGRPTALHATVDRPWETWHLVGLLNWREGPMLCALPLERILLDGREWLAYDVWGRASLGIATHAVGRRIGARSCLLLALRANLARPQLLGTSRHVTAGAVEIDDLTWDADSATLRGRAAPDAVSLIVRSPHPFVPTTSAGGDLGPLAEARTSLELPPAPGWRDWHIQFGQAPPPPRGQPIHFVGLE